MQNLKTIPTYMTLTRPSSQSKNCAAFDEEEKDDELRKHAETACAAFQEARVRFVELENQIEYLEGQLKLRDAEIEELRARMNLYQEERG